MKMKLSVFIASTLLLILAFGAVGVALAAPAASVTLDGDGDVFIGASPIPMTLTFDNTAATGLANIGYGPFIDVYFPVNGADSTGAAQPMDGLDYIAGSATYLGNPVTEVLLTFPTTPLGGICGAGESFVEHPYAVDSFHDPILVCGTPGDKLVVFQLPFGSFTPDQPPATVAFESSLSNFADLNTPLFLSARGGYQFGADPLDNPCCDPSFFTDGTPTTITDNPVGAVNPILLTLTKINTPPESEVATGPNYPHTYTVTVEAAPGQAITNLDVFDYIDDNIVITAITAPGASSITLGGLAPSFPAGPVVSNGTANRLVVTYASFTGTVSFDIEYYVPLRDAGGSSIITPNNGAASITTNTANTVGDWNPLDPRDPAGTNNATAGDAACPACPPLVTHENEPLPIQKGLENLTDGTALDLDGNPSPGDVIQYTLSIQVSDFFALDDADVFDVISDGQRLTGNPVLSYTQHGTTVGGVVTNFQVREYFTGGTPGIGGLPDPDVAGEAAGDTVLAIDLSAELALYGFNEILGGCVPVGGTGIGDPNCDPLSGGFNGGATSITITYQTTIQDAFSDEFPSGDSSVDHGDTLDNVVTLEVDTVLDTTNLAPTAVASQVVDDTSAGLTIAQGLTEKAIFAITDLDTGLTTLSPAAVPEISPGDVITFRLRYEMPSTDFEDFSLSDYLPLPVLDANDVAAFNDVISDGSSTVGTGLPASGQAMWGPTGVTDANVNFRSRLTALGLNLQNGGTVPTITNPGSGIPGICGGTAIAAAENFLNFCFGDFDDPANVDSFIDVLFSITVSDDPFADELFLTNFVRGGTGSTNAAPANSDEIVMFELRQPILLVRKGISDSTNPGESFTEIPNPSLVPAGDPTVPPFSGTIESSDGGNGEVDNGTNADVDGLDAGDTVRYVITIQNTGGAAAFDIELFDSLPLGLTCNSATVNLNVTLGDGTPISYINQGTADPCDFFTNFDGNALDGIELLDPADGLCQSAEVDPARAVIVITYDLTIDNTVSAGDLLINTTTLTNYANSEGGPTHLADPANYPQDTAQIEIAGTIEKDIISTSEADSSDVEVGIVGDERPVLVGEVVTYRVYTRIPEGTTNNLQFRDNTPMGLQYVAGSARFAFISNTLGNITSSDAAINGAGPSLSGNSPATPLAFVPLSAISGGTTSGDPLIVSFGNVTNVENDNGAEYVVLEFEMVVSNIAGNQDGVFLLNTATLRKNGADLVTSDEDTLDADNDPVALVVIEPVVEFVSKTQNVTTGDAGDLITYTISVQNTGNAPAYDFVITDNLPTTFVSFSTGFTTTGTAPTSINHAAGVVTATWNSFAAGATATIQFTVMVNNTVRPLDSWTNTANLVYTSLPGSQGTGNETPGNSGDDDGERNGTGGVNEYADTVTSPSFTVPEPTTTKQLEHPVNIPTASTVFPGGYSDSTSDPNTGTSEHNAANVDLAIGEEFSYILTWTFPEGTTASFVPIDVVSPIGITGSGREFRVIEILGAEVVHVGSNLSGNGLQPLGFTSFLFIDNNGDGDLDYIGLNGTFDQDVLNTPDGVVNDNDRYVIRITARLDDEDASGGPADDLPAIANSDGNVGGNRIQTEWRDTNNTQYFRNVFADVDMVEPTLTITKGIIASSSPSAVFTPALGASPENSNLSGVDAGDTVTFRATVVNTGNAPAYNVTLVDTPPTSLSSCVLSAVRFDNGSTPTTTGDLFTTGLVLNSANPLTPNGVINGAGTDVLFVEYTCTINFTALQGEVYTNTIQITSFNSQPAGSPDVRNYVGPSDTANFTLTVSNATKSITATSETATSDAGLPNTGTGNVPVTIGEVFRYQLVVDVPEGTSTDLLVVDQLATGIELIADTTTEITVLNFGGGNFDSIDFGAGLEAANGATVDLHNGTTFTFTAPFNVVDYNAGTNLLTFNLGDIVNNDSDANIEQIIITFNVVVRNTAANNLGTILANDFDVFTDDAGSVSQLRDTSNVVNAIIQEPQLTIVKSVSPLTGDAGDTFTYTITVTNANGANNSTAFEVQVTDDLGALTDLDLTAVTATGATDNSNLATDFVDVTIPSLAPGASFDITLTVILRSSATLNELITNTSTAIWTSLPATGTTGNPTGSNTPGGSGADNGERNGSTPVVAPNDYVTMDTVSFAVTGTVNTIKSIDGTSEGHTDDTTADTNADPRPVAVGEVITYRLVVEVPEATSPDVQVTDTLSPNVEFIAGTARISYSANNSMAIAGVPGILNEINPTTSIPAGLISFGVTGPRELRFDVGSVVNNDIDDAATTELLIIEFQVVVVNTSDNILGAIWANDFEVDLNNDGTDEDVSNEVYNIVQEPVVTATKAIIGAEPLDALEPVTYDIVVTAGSASNQSTAFDLVVTDVLHPDLFLDLNDVDVISAPPYASTPISGTPGAGGTVLVTISELRPGDSVTIRVIATVLTTVSPGETIDNDAVVTWTSLPGPQGTANATPGNSGDSNGERNGTTTGENDHTTPTNTVNFTIASAEPVKSIDDTSEIGTSDAENGSAGNERPVAIGEEVTYRLAVVLPESTTIDFRLDDVLANGIELVAGSARVSYVADTLPSFNGDFAGIQNENEPSLPFPAARVNFDGGSRTLSFDFGSIINNDGDASREYIIVEFTVVVVDDVVNNTGQIWANDFDVVIDEGLPTETITTSNVVGIIVVEPAVNITKTFTPDTQIRGGTVTMTLVVDNLAANGATGPAYDLQITDVLDDWLNVESNANVTVSFNAAATSFGSSFDLTNSVITSGFATGVTDNVDVRISALPVDGVATITVTMQIDPNADPLLLSRTITNTATVVNDTLSTDVTPDDEDREYTDNASDDLNVVKPTLLVTKTDGGDVAAGALMSYTVSIQNTGTPNFAATNVQFRDQIPTGFIVTLVTPSQGTCSPIVGGVLSCSMGTIASGATASVVITGRYPSTTASGTIANNISYVTSTEGNHGNDGNDTPGDNDDERAEEPTTIVRQIDLAITKIVDDASPNEGDLITFTLTVTNNGPSQATNVQVTDDFPDLGPNDLTFVQFVPSTLPCTYAAPTLTCTFPTVNVGQVITIGIEATVDAGAATVPTTPITNTATVSSLIPATEPDSNPANNTDDATVTVDSMDLQVVKLVDDATPNEGDTIVYTITVTNLGPAPASGIQIFDTLPTELTNVSDNSATTGTTYLGGIWDLQANVLDAGESLSLQITADVAIGASASPQPIANTASLTVSNQPDTNPANNDSTANIAVGGFDLSIVKGVNNPTPDEGDTIVYSIIVQNLGAANATNITVLDNLPPDLIYTGVFSVNRSGTTYDGTTWTIPSLAAGQSIRLDITVTVGPDTAGDTITNTANITGPSDANPANNSDDASITVRLIDLAVTKTVDNASPNEGDTIVYSITVVNNGPSSATGVLVSDALPAGVTYVSDNAPSLLDSTGAATSYTAGIWDVGTLNAGASLTLQITATVDIGATAQPQPIVNTASALADQDETTLSNNSDDANIAVGGLDLQVTKTVDNATVNEGDTIVYTITVENFGAANATDVAVTDDLAIIPVTYSGVYTASQGTFDGLTWTVGNLNAGDTASLQITATVNTGTSGTSFMNQATLDTSVLDQADSNPANNEDDAVVTVGEVDIEVLKVVDNPAPLQGDNVTYTITVTNLGAGDATGVIISEDLPLDGVNLIYVSHTVSQGNFTVGAPGTWSIGNLNDGQSATLQLTVTVAIDDGQILNVASVSNVNEQDSNPANDDDDATITLNGIDLAVVKTVDNPTPENGDIVTYTIVATNNGPSQATLVTVLDPLPAGVSFVTGSETFAPAATDDAGNPMSYNETSGEWTIGTLNAGSSYTLTLQAEVLVNGGVVINTAEIDGFEPESDDSNNIDDATISVDSADLSLTKGISTTSPQVGDFITYTVTVSNAGPNIAYNVEVTDTMPSTVVYTGTHTASQGTFNGTVWTVGTIPVNGAASLQITVQVISNVGTFVNVAEVTASDQTDPDSTPNNGITTEDDYAESSFVFDPPFGRKVFDPSGLPELEWTVIWVNPNTNPLGVTVNDPIPAGTTFVAGSLTCTSPGTIVINTCTFDPVSNSIIFDGTLFPNPGATPATINSATNRLIINYRVNVPSNLNVVRNEAILDSVNGDNVAVSATWNRGDVGSPATGAAINLTKYVDPAIAFPGGTLTWILEVSNPSGAAATNIVVTDNIPVGLTIQSTQADAGTVNVVGQNVTWNVGTVGAGQTLRLRIVTQVSPTLSAPVTNTALVTGDNVMPMEASATAAFVEGLPNTGETPLWIWVLAAALIIVPLSAGLWWLKRRMA